jgi:predicted PurR-regulated permease PerM
MNDKLSEYISWVIILFAILIGSFFAGTLAAFAAPVLLVAIFILIILSIIEVSRFK